MKLAANSSILRHRHDGRPVRATVLAQSGMVQIDYVCRTCEMQWSEHEGVAPFATEPSARGTQPIFRRKPDRRRGVRCVS